MQVLLITCCRRYSKGNYKVIVIPRNLFSIPWTTTLVTFSFTALTLIKYRKVIRLIHFPYASNAGKWGYLLSTLRYFFSIKYLLHCHGGGMGEWKILSGNRILFNNAESLISVSKILQKEYEKRTRRTVHLIYPVYPFNAPEESKNKLREKFNFSKDNHIILYVGSLKSIKAPQTLMNAFLGLKNESSQFSNVRLVIIGMGPMMTTLEKQATKSGWVNDISIMGYIPNEEISEFYKISDYYVITSHFEGTSKSLLEAMFNKLPIIGTKVPGIDNIIIHNSNGLLIDKDNANQLMFCLKRLIKDPGLSHNLGLAAYQTYQESYTFDKTLSSLLSIYDSFN
jgi:glycosyltransferase involved in cell wall biosynthesis